MKNKKQLTFWGVVARDIWFIFRTLFWGIPKATVIQLRNLNYIKLRKSIDDPQDDSSIYVYVIFSWVFIFIVNFVLYGILWNETWSSAGLMFVLSIIEVYVFFRYIWYRASLQKEEERVLKHNLEYIELCDDELTEDFYNTVSGSGG